MRKKHFTGLKTKIIISTIIPITLSFLLLGSVLLSVQFNLIEQTARAELLQISQKYSSNFESKINTSMNYLSIVAQTLEHQTNNKSWDRVELQQTIFSIFDDYNSIDGSSIYFEPNKFDGKDSQYIGSNYGTELSGRICYYFYKSNGETHYLPEGLSDEIEFDLPHYTHAKEAVAPIYTNPTVYEINGQNIPMFTLTYPLKDQTGDFIGAVTVDLFLDDIYTMLQEESIYETGYIIIANDKNQIIYSPVFENIGKNRTEGGLDYTLPSRNENIVYSSVKSIINGKESLIAINSIYIPELDAHFYISASAPTAEIKANGISIMNFLIIFSLIMIAGIAYLLYYLIEKITKPIMEITDSINKIANGDEAESEAFINGERDVKTTGEMNILSDAIKKMLTQINEIQELKLQSLELNHKKEKAEASAKAKTDFLAKMSHEIRTPMNAVMGMAELLLRKNLAPDAYENALVIKSASANLLSIINDILDFSKIESGMLEITETDYMLPSLINDVLSIIRVRLIDKPIQFVAQIAPDIPAALIGDEIRIRQILINLLSNAVKYTNEGSISFTVNGNVIGNIITLTVNIQDSGIGIKNEDIDKLFGDFIQIDMETNKGVEGTGLGLAISRNLCRIMGGDISVESEYGNGSTFTVTLPQKIKTFDPFASVSDPKSKSVLIYEPRKLYRDSVANTIESLNVPCKIAADIPELFEELGKHRYVFASSFAYGSIAPALAKLDDPPQLVIMADITENSAPINTKILSLPTYSLPIANILNDVYEDYSDSQITGASFTAPEATILLVDDITANLKVCEGLMLPYETTIVTCSSGKKALELVAEQKFDLVFMDHMMPEMDGIETTQRIRRMNGDYFQRLPIIALTANAISGVREMFIQNGMNDFLAKPIETMKLDAILEKWITKNKRKKINPQEHSETKNTSEFKPESDFTDTLRKIPELSVDKALSILGGSKSTYERIVKISFGLIDENIARLNKFIGGFTQETTSESALGSPDLPNYAIEVHGVKGVLNNVGAYKLGDIAYELEVASKNGDLEICQNKHPEFIRKLTEFSEKMIGLIKQSEVLTKPKGEKTLIQEKIPELKEALEFFDSAGATQILSCLSEYSYGDYGDEIDILVDELNKTIERFDFDMAEDLIIKLESELFGNE